MKKWNVAEAKTHFPRIVEEGESIVICRRSIPVAKLLPYFSNVSGKCRRTKMGEGSGVAIHGDLTESTIPQSEQDMLR
jgi:antitoxin (DNA-binding transcriptional repressor) of toxin-antitoxin stability system